MATCSINTLPPEIFNLIVKHLILITHEYHFPANPSYTLYTDWNLIWPITDVLSLAFTCKSLRDRVYSFVFSNFGTNPISLVQLNLFNNIQTGAKLSKSMQSAIWFGYFHDYNIPTNSFLHYERGEQFYLNYATKSIPSPSILAWVNHLCISSFTIDDQILFSLSSDTCKPEYFPSLSQLSLNLCQNSFPLKDKTIGAFIRNLIRHHSKKIICHVHQRIEECKNLIIPLLGMEQDILETVKTLELNVDGLIYVDEDTLSQIPLMKNLDKLLVVYDGFGWSPAFKISPEMISIASISKLVADLPLSELELSISASYNHSEWRIPKNLECLTVGIEMFLFPVPCDEVDRFNNITHLELSFYLWNLSDNEFKGRPTIPIRNLTSLALHDLDRWHDDTKMIKELVHQNPNLVNLLINGLESNELGSFYSFLHKIERLEILSEKQLNKTAVDPYKNDTCDPLSDILQNAPNLKSIFLPIGKKKISFKNLCDLAVSEKKRKLELIQVYTLTDTSKFGKGAEPLLPKEIFISPKKDKISPKRSSQLLSQVYAPVMTYGDLMRNLEVVRKSGIIDFKKLKQLVEDKRQGNKN